MNATKKQGSVCVDASVALSWLFYDTYRKQTDALWEKWSAEAIDMVVPPMFHAEVTTGIRKRVHFKQISPVDGERLFEVYSGLEVKVIDKAEMYRGAWRLARQYNLPVCYDTQYLAVAELEDCEFWTLDRKLLNSVKGNKRVRWAGDHGQR